MAYPSEYAEQSDAKIERNAVEAAEWSLAYVGELSARIDAVVSRLCGVSPTSAASGNVEKLSAPGVLPSLKDKAEKAERQISGAMYALDRLEKSI